MVNDRTPEESSAVEYQFTLTIESRTPISNLDVLSSLEIDFDDADSITCDPVVKESLTTDTAYREGFEACREMAAKVAESHSDYESDNEAQRTAYAIEKKIRAIPTPTTKGGA